MKKASVFLAEGFELVEALMVVDLLKRAQIEVSMVSINEEKMVTSGCKVSVMADTILKEMNFADTDAFILPGGMPGTTNLLECEKLKEVLLQAKEDEKLLAAICAAPSVLAHHGLLEGKKATCFPGVEDKLVGAEVVSEKVVKDGLVITGCALGAAVPFSLELIKALVDEECATKVKNSICYGHMK